MKRWDGSKNGELSSTAEEVRSRVQQYEVSFQILGLYLVNQMLCLQGPGGHEARECENAPAALQWAPEMLKWQNSRQNDGWMG